ncbi:MAG: hypothetical protein K6D54_01865 [Bacteroidales bacterium]|nr:hypothetical protein [Bacteroidales bacterium]
MQRNTGSTKFWSSARYSGDISSWSWTQGSNTAKAAGIRVVMVADVPALVKTLFK